MQIDIDFYTEYKCFVPTRAGHSHHYEFSVNRKNVYGCILYVRYWSKMLDLKQQIWQSPCFHGNHILVTEDKNIFVNQYIFLKKVGYLQAYEENKTKCHVVTKMKTTIDLSEEVTLELRPEQ